MSSMLKNSKLIVFLLAFVLVTMSLGSAYGFVACEDGPLGRIHHENHHHGEQEGDTGPVPFYPPQNDSDDSCRDTQVRFGSCLPEKIGTVKYCIDPPIAFELRVDAPVRIAAPPAPSAFLKPFQVAPWNLRAHKTIVLLI